MMEACPRRPTGPGPVPWMELTGMPPAVVFGSRVHAMCMVARYAVRDRRVDAVPRDGPAPGQGIFFSSWLSLQCVFETPSARRSQRPAPHCILHFFSPASRTGEVAAPTIAGAIACTVAYANACAVACAIAYAIPSPAVRPATRDGPVSPAATGLSTR